MKIKRLLLFRRALWVGLSVTYSLTNVVGAHAVESSFWGERRRASRNRTFSDTLKSDSLLAGLPGKAALAAPYALPLERPSGGSLADYSPLGKNIVESPDSRIIQIAQSVRPYGTVRYVRESKKPGAPLVLHIQDVHGNLGAQQNMAGMVMALARDVGVRWVGMEGAWGAFAVNEFRPYPNQDIVKKVGGYFLKKELIGGPELAGLASNQPLTLWGVEDPSLYQANVDAVKGSLTERGHAEEFLASLNRKLDNLKNSHYSALLMDFDNNRSLYDQNQRELGQYLQILWQFDARGPGAMAARFPQIARFLSALEEEKSIDFTAVERERQALVSILVKKLSQEEQKNLIHRSVELRAGAISHNTYHLFLRNLCAQKGVRLGQHPTLLAYMHYVNASEEIERDALLTEMNALEITAQEALIETTQQRNLVELSRDALRLKKLIANELTPEEWADYTAHREQILRLTDRLKSQALSPTDPWPELPTLLAPFEAFCARAIDRNRGLTENLLAVMKGENQPVAVLVAGGFHTEGLMKNLQTKDVSVMVLTPTIGPLDPNHRYLDVFAHDPLPLEKIFTGEAISLKAVCGLSLQGNFRDTVDALHFGIVGFSLNVKRDLMARLRTRKTKIQDALDQYLEELTRLVPHLRGMALAVEVAGEYGINLSSGLKKQSGYFAQNDKGPIVLMLTHHDNNGMTSNGNGGSDFNKNPEKFGKGFSHFPVTAIPEIVQFLSNQFAVSPKRSILFFANLVQSTFVFILLFSFPYAFGSIALDPRILPTVGYFLISQFLMDFRRTILRFDRFSQTWVIDPSLDKRTKKILWLYELVFNLPLLAAFYLFPPADPSLIWPGGAILLSLSVALRSGYNILAHRLNRGQMNSLPPISHQPLDPLIDLILKAFQEGFLEDLYGSITASVPLNEIKRRMNAIAQKTVRDAIGNSHWKKNGMKDGPYDIYESEDLPLVIKIPNRQMLDTLNVTESELRKQFKLVKNRMGGLFVPMTLLNSFPIRLKNGKKVYKSFVIIQEKWEEIPLLAPRHTFSNSVRENQREILVKQYAQRQEKWVAFLAAMEERNLGFAPHSNPETELGFVGNTMNWMGQGLGNIREIPPLDHRLTHKIQLTDDSHSRRPENSVQRSLNGSPAPTGESRSTNPTMNGKTPVARWRVHDVAEDQVRQNQGEYLNTIFKDHLKGKTHSVFSPSLLERFFRFLGFSEATSTRLAKVFVVVLIPIGETFLYGNATPAMTHLLSMATHGIGFVPFTPLIVGFISATLHIVLWRLQGEKITSTDFFSWWFIGSLFSIPFEIYPSTGWAGELPWLISGFSHIYLNWLVVSRAAEAMGELLNIKWLKYLKPGSLAREGDSRNSAKWPLSKSERLSLRTSIFEAISSFSGPLSPEDSPKEMDLEINGQLYRVHYGQGKNFEGWVETQLSAINLSDENNNPLRIVDKGFDLSYSYLVTQVIKEEKGVSPLKESLSLSLISEEGLVSDFVAHISATVNREGTQGLNRRHLRQLVSDIYPKVEDRSDFPTKSLMATAGAVVFLALRNKKMNPIKVIAYLKTTKSFQDILAMHNDPSQLSQVYNQFAGHYFESANLDLNNWSNNHKAFIAFLKTPENTEPRQVISPVPAVWPLELDSELQGSLKLKDVLLNGGKSAELDMVFRTYKPTNRPYTKTNADRFRSFIRQKVKDNWGTTHVKDPWLATVMTEHEGSIGLSVAESRMAATARGSLRWWTLAELWLTVATPRDWLNWRYYVLRWKERTLFRGVSGFSAEDRLTRATLFTSLLRSTGNSVLVSREESPLENQRLQSFDVDLLLSAAGVAGENGPSIFTTYNRLLEQATQVDFWREFSSTKVFNVTSGPVTPTQGMNGGTLIFHVDALLPGSPLDEKSQREVATALAGVLLSNRSEHWKGQVYLVSSVESVSGQQINGAWLADILVKKYGVLFDRVKGLNVILPGKENSFCSKIEGAPRWTIHLQPLLQNLGLINDAESVHFWTHDDSIIDTGNLSVHIENILTLSKKILEFFSLQTFLQTNA